MFPYEWIDEFDCIVQNFKEKNVSIIASVFLLTIIVLIVGCILEDRKTRKEAKNDKKEKE